MAVPWYAEAPGTVASPAYDYARRLFGGGVTVAESDVIVSTSPIRLCLNNPDRVGLTIVNNGSSQLTIGFTSRITTVQGTPVGQNGGTAQLLVFEDGELTTFEVYGVAPAAGQSVHVVEVVRT